MPSKPAVKVAADRVAAPAPTLFIDGAWASASSGATFEATNPATGAVIGHLAEGGRAEATRAIQAASRAAAAWGRTSPFERAALLERVAAIIEGRRDELARALTEDQGKPLHAEAYGEVEELVLYFRMAAADATRIEGLLPPSVDPAKRVLVYRVPKGVVGVITPWNWPYTMPAELIAPALAAGNAVVWNPARLTSQCSVALARCIVEAGLPPGVFNLVTGPGDEVGDEIAGDPRVAAIGFVGSTKTGTRIAQRAAGKELLLEMGGNGPLVILDDADLEAAVRATITACFLNAGQSCTAGERVLVDRSVHDRYLELLVDTVQREVRLGDPRDGATTMGPLNNERTAAKAEHQVAEAIERGATLHAGGRRAPQLGSPLFFQPTILDRVTETMEIAREETFGPVVPITVIDGESEALQIIESSPYGLLTAVFTRDLARGLRFAESARAGWVNINEGTNYWESHLPFGGRAGSQSGLGRVGGRFSIERLTELKTIVVKSRLSPAGRARLEEHMAGLPNRARVVVIGAGIVGNSMAWHLARLGWRDIVLLEKGTLPSPGGSTGHASNFIFLTDHSKEMTAFTLDSVEQYRELGVFTQTGGIEVARTPERMQELTRRITSSKSWGIEPAELISSKRVKELVPFINEDIVLGGVYWPKVGVVDSLEAGTLMRRKAQELGALTIGSGVEVTGLDVEDGRVKRVRTDHGDIEAETVVIACGVWSPRIAAMAGASIPLTPAVHQMIDIGPVAIFENVPVAVGYPIIRDVDTNMYERQHGNEFEVGSYAHRTILMDPDDIPSIAEAALSPTMLPFTQDDFDPQLEDALELFPDVMGDERAGVKLAINGLLSLTPDGNPIIGETPEVKGLWSAAAIWIKEAPGIARCIAEWMTNGEPEIDPHGSDIARFYDHHRTQQHIAARTTEGYNKTYGIVHPMEQWASNRGVRLSPFFEREKGLRAEFFEAAGWERPYFYGSNEPLLDEFGDRVMPREAEWESRWWSPIINAEHLAMRDRAGIVDLSAFVIFDVTGPGAAAYLERLCVNKVDVPAGKTVYTPLLNGAGGILADLTIMRLAHDRFRVVTGGGMGMRDRKIFTDALPADGSAQLFDATNSFTTIGLWGPRARDILAGVTSDDVSHAGFPFLTSKSVDINGVRALASRISYVGELGWEIYVPIEQGLRVWDALWESGTPHGMVPVGIGTYAVTARLEKGYRAHGNELELDFNLVDAGMARPNVKDADFVGKAAYLRQRSAPPVAVLCTLTLDDPTSKSGVKRYMLGREPILSRDGAALTDAHGRRSYVTSAGSGPSVGKHLLMSYLPPAEAVVGTQLLVEYLGEQYPVTVAVAGSTPLFDPENLRIRS